MTLEITLENAVPVLTKATPDGKPVVLSAWTYLKQITLSSTIDGKPFESAKSLYKLPKPVTANSGAIITHSVGKVGLTAQEADTVEVGIRAIYDAYEATPEGMMEALRSTRSDLVLDYRMLVDDQEHMSSQLWDAGDEGGSFGARADYERRIEAAVQAIQSFDAQHPEVVAEIKADKAAATTRFLAAD